MTESSRRQTREGLMKMTEDKVKQIQAEVLSGCGVAVSTSEINAVFDLALSSIRASLAAPGVRVPVAWIRGHTYETDIGREYDEEIVSGCDKPKGEGWTPLYTAAPASPDAGISGNAHGAAVMMGDVDLPDSGTTPMCLVIQFGDREKLLDAINAGRCSFSVFGKEPSAAPASPDAGINLAEWAAQQCDLIGADWKGAGDWPKFHAADYLASWIRKNAPATARSDGWVSDGWQPIETAPKDGTEVLVWRADSGSFIAKYGCPQDFMSDREIEDALKEGGAEWLEIPDWLSDIYGRQDGNETPTHWRALPAAPASGAEKGVE